MQNEYRLQSSNQNSKQNSNYNNQSNWKEVVVETQCPMNWRSLLKRPELRLKSRNDFEHNEDNCNSESFFNKDNLMPVILNQSISQSHSMLSTIRQKSSIPKTGRKTTRFESYPNGREQYCDYFIVR